MNSFVKEKKTLAFMLVFVMQTQPTHQYSWKMITISVTKINNWIILSQFAQYATL